MAFKDLFIRKKKTEGLSERGNGNIPANSINTNNINNDRIAIEQLQKLAEFTGGYNGTFPEKQSEQIATVFACIKLIADNISKCPLQVIQDTGRQTTVVNNALNQQLNYRPSTMFGYKNWISNLITVQELNGNCFLTIGNGTFDFLNPALIDDANISNGQIFYQSSQNKDVNYRQDEVLHFKNICAANGNLIFGSSALKSLKNEIQTYYKTTKTLDSIYSNGINSRVYLEQLDERPTTTEKQDEKIADIQNRNSGFNNASNVLVLPPMFTLKSLTIPREDLAILASANFSEETICSVFGVPYFLVKFAPTVAIKLDEIKTYFVGVLINRMEAIEAELTDKLIDIDSRNKGISIRFDKSKLYQNDISFLTNPMNTLVTSGIISRNEARHELGFDADPNPNMDLKTIQVQNVSIDDTDFKNHPLLNSKNNNTIDNNLKPTDTIPQGNEPKTN